MIVYLIPSLASSLFLFSVAVYLISIKPRRKYIIPLSLICIASFIWNTGTVLTNLTDGKNIHWAEFGALGLVLIPSFVFHFASEYTNFFKRKYYLLAYLPAIFLSICVFSECYVKGVTYLTIGYEPEYKTVPFLIGVWIGLFLTILSTFLLYKYYKESVGLKKRQAFYILFAIPANAILSFISYSVMNAYNLAQFPVGSSLDFAMVMLIVYAILKYKLPVESPAEIDFRILAETASEGICIIDEGGYVEYSNSHFCEMIKSSNKEIIGKKFVSFIPEVFRKDFEEYFNRIMKGEKLTGIEIKLMRGNEVFTAEMNASPIIWNDKIVGGFITIRDIEERKKVERELRKQKTYFQALFESSPEAIVSLDEKHRVVDLNPAFIELFGYNLEDLKGKNIDDFILPDDEMEKGKEITKRVLRGEVVKSEGKRKRKDGSVVYVSVLGAPIFIGGKQVGIFGIYRDITARKNAEEEREFYNSLLRHDVANKNMVIQGNLELLNETSLTERQKSLVEDALKAARSGSELIEKIRKLHRVGKEGILTKMNINDVLSKVVRNFEQQAKNKGIKIEYTPINAIIKADSLIESVFSNIIQNAIIHSNCSKIKIYGGKEKKGEKTFYKILIEDDGIGIPEDIRENIFAPRVKRERSPGSGLGLYLVKKLVESYGGSVELRKQEGRGTVFCIYLPSAE